MKKPKFRGHLRAPYLSFKEFIKSRLPSNVLTSRLASTLRRPTRTFTPPSEDQNVEIIANISVQNGNSPPSPPVHTHGTVLSDVQPTQPFPPPKENERFERILDTSFRHGPNSPWPKYAHGTALFDTGSKYNLVTRQFLKDNGFEWQPSISATSIVQMNDDTIEVLGEIQGRWYPVNALEEDNFRPRYEMSIFKIVDSNNFDLIIGRITIIELKLLLPNPSFFGAFIGAPILVDPDSITVGKQQEFERKRQKEQEEMKKAEEEQARKAKASNPQSR